MQALTSQLDRAQATLAVKARLGMPLTFALKDLEIDLRAHVEMMNGHVRLRLAGPRDTSSSVLRFTLTTITRPVIEENTIAIEPDEPSLQEVLGEDVTEEERRRLEWAGIHNVSQLREMQKDNGERVLEQLVQIPAVRLREALRNASRPGVRFVAPDKRRGVNPRLRVGGFNLAPEVPLKAMIDGEAVEIVEAKNSELVLAPRPDQLRGELTLMSASNDGISFAFDAMEANDDEPAQSTPFLIMQDESARYTTTD